MEIISNNLRMILFLNNYILCRRINYYKKILMKKLIIFNIETFVNLINDI